MAATTQRGSIATVHHRLTDRFHHRPLAAGDPGAGGRELELAPVRWREQAVRHPLVGQQRDIADEIAIVAQRGRRALNQIPQCAYGFAAVSSLFARPAGLRG